MADLRVNLFGKQLAGPVIAASGTFGSARNMQALRTCACWAAFPAKA